LTGACITQIAALSDVRRLDAAGAQAHGAVAAAASARSWVTSTSVAPRSRLQREDQVDDRAAGALVEIAGRLVGDEDRRIRRDSARDGDALLLAAGQLRGIMVEALAEADRLRSSAAARSKASSAPASSSGTATFSSAVMVGMRWKDWKTMPI
jgi:hypothetical protein